jgi:hypothetical protein
MTRYDITSPSDSLDPERAQWLREHLGRDQYRIENTGFLIDSYSVSFPDPRAETLYLLRWGS